MPFAETGPVKLYYESRGRGPVVLLVIGLGMTLGGWWRTAPVLARSFRVLSFDNRGIGRSDASALPYSVATMADDAIAVLDAAGHVVGRWRRATSLGSAESRQLRTLPELVHVGAGELGLVACRCSSSRSSGRPCLALSVAGATPASRR